MCTSLNSLPFRCKGGSMCSTGCFAKFGSPQLDGLLSCSVEKNDCVHVPGKEDYGWKPDTLSDLPGIMSYLCSLEKV